MRTILPVILGTALSISGVISQDLEAARQDLIARAKALDLDTPYARLIGILQPGKVEASLQKKQPVRKFSERAVF